MNQRPGKKIRQIKEQILDKCELTFCLVIKKG